MLFGKFDSSFGSSEKKFFGFNINSLSLKNVALKQWKLKLMSADHEQHLPMNINLLILYTMTLITLLIVYKVY